MESKLSMEKMIGYEKMLAELSKMAMILTDIDIFIRDALQIIGMTIGVSRVFIFNYMGDSNTFECAFGWDMPELKINRTKSKIILHIPMATSVLLKGEVINFSDTSKMPFIRYRKHLLKEKIKSTLNMPLMVSNKLYGFIGFDEHRYNREWHDSDLYILTTASQIISHAIENSNQEKRLIEHKNLLESIFASVQDAIITVDSELRVITTNSIAHKICHMDITQGERFASHGYNCSRACLPLLKETLSTCNPVRDYQIRCINSLSSDRAVQGVACISCSPLRNASGDFMGAVMTVRDVSRQAFLEDVLRERSKWQDIIGQSECMQKIYDLLQTLADMDTTVLITGESGTGKERVAHALHYGGRRANNPFIRVNCSALAENLLESELFGHAKGAFTGAEKLRIGRFESAQGGTILLDEIGDISPRIQLKLLRVLEEKEIERVGETIPRKIDVRIIAATNRDLKKAIKNGEFREDLWYRLNVMPIHIPPLRDRMEDVPVLAHYFISRFNTRLHKNIKNISSEVMQIFMHHSWPGNVRELENVIERAFVFCKGETLLPEHILLPDTEETGKPENNSVKNEILDALSSTDWNISKSSRRLGISRWTLYRRMLQLGIHKPS